MPAAFLFAALLAAQVGPADTVEAVRFSGNRSFKARALAGVVSARKGEPLIEARVDNDARLLAQFYRDNGFRSAEVERGLGRGRKHSVVTFFVREGPRAVIDTVVISGNEYFDTGRLLGLVPARPGRNFRADLRGASEAALLELHTSNGFPFVEVEGEWSFADTLASLNLEVREGPRCRIGAVRVRGNTKVRTRTVLRAAEVSPGEVFNRRRLQVAQSRIYATRLFSRVTYYVLRPDTLKDSVIVRFDVTEQPHRMLLFGGGVEATPWRLLASVGWEHANVFNLAHNFEAGVEFSPDFTGDYRASIEARYRIPYIIFGRIDFLTHPFFYYDRQDTLVSREYGVETGLSRNLLPQLSAGLFNRFRLVADTSSGITNSIALSSQYDTRDDVLDPRKGAYARAGVEVAGGLLSGNNDFYRVTGEARGFVPLPFGFTAAARAMAGRVFPYGRTGAVPSYEAFMLGGRNSLRGYAERSLGPDSTGDERFGPMVLNANAELRTPYLFGWVGLVGFLDAGEVVAPDAGFATGTLEYSAGAGVRVRTPIGPVRVDWGKRLRDPEPGDRGKFYLGLLHVF